MSPSQTEAYAILTPLTDLQGKGQSITIKSDCEELLRSLKHNMNYNKDISSIVEKITQEAKKLEYLACIKVSRADVRKVYDLANWSRRA